jgi:hypothetical protein
MSAWALYSIEPLLGRDPGNYHHEIKPGIDEEEHLLAWSEQNLARRDYNYTETRNTIHLD